MNEERPNYYAVIPAEVRYDTDLKDKAKLLYGEITALSEKDGYCYANNKYFASLYNVSTTTISLLIKNLIDKGYLESEIIYKEGSKEILNRYLKIIKYPIKENLKDNNTSINKKENNNINIIIKEKVRFIKPTIEEIRNYCNERNNGVDPELFYDFYESKNWYVGKNKMVNWQAAVRTFERNRRKEDSTSKPKLEKVAEGVFKY